MATMLNPGTSPDGAQDDESPFTMWDVTEDDGGGATLQVEAVSDPAGGSSPCPWGDRPSLEVVIEGQGITVGPYGRRVRLSAMQHGKSVPIECNTRHDGGAVLEVDARDLERLHRTLGRAIAMAKRAGLIPTPEAAD